MTEESAGPEVVENREVEEAGPAKVMVRPAVPADTISLKVLLKRSLDEIREGQFSRINDTKLRGYILVCIEEGACLVAELEGAIVGTICLRTLQEIWSDDHFLNEEWFYVLPAFRGTGAAVKLLDTAERLADQMGLPVYMAINNHDPERTELLFDHRVGYRRTGANYLRLPRNGQQEVHDDDDA